jgi:hypothetical protein
MNWRFRVVLGTLLCALFMAPVLYRPAAESSQLLAHGKQLLSKGQGEEGIRFLGDAVMWRAPFNSSAKEAARELTSISNDTTLSEKMRILARAQLLRGLASSRSWMWDLDSFWQQVDFERLQQQVIADQVGSSPRVSAAHSPPRVDYVWQGVSHLCLIVWVGALFTVIWRCLDRSGRLRTEKTAHFFILVGIACFSFFLWLLALSRA